MKRLHLLAMIVIALSCAASARAAGDFHSFSSDAEMDRWLRVNSATYAAVAQSIEAREYLKGYRFSSQPDVARGMVLYRDGYIEVQLNPALSGPGRMTTLIFEVINGSRHRDHQQVDAALASGVIESAETYGLAREMIEFEALRTHALVLKEIDAAAGPLPREFFSYVSPLPQSAKDYQPPELLSYLKAQKESGHTAFYHKQYAAWKAEQAAAAAPATSVKTPPTD